MAVRITAMNKPKYMLICASADEMARRIEGLYYFKRVEAFRGNIVDILYKYGNPIRRSQRNELDRHLQEIQDGTFGQVYLSGSYGHPFAAEVLKRIPTESEFVDCSLDGSTLQQLIETFFAARNVQAQAKA